MLTSDHSEAIALIDQRIDEIMTMRRAFAHTCDKSSKEATYTLWELDTRMQRLEDSKNTLIALQEWGEIQRANAKK